MLRLTGKLNQTLRLLTKYQHSYTYKNMLSSLHIKGLFSTDKFILFSKQQLKF